MSRLLINEPPLMVLPSLAILIGLNEAIVLQQVHYWATGKYTKKVNGEYWYKSSMGRWHDNFLFWGKRTLERTFKSLKDLGLLVTIDDPTTHSFDKVKLFRIDYEKLDSLYDQNEHIETDKMAVSETTIRRTTHRQNGGFSIETIEETNTGASTTTEKNKEEKKSVEEKEIDDKNENLEKRELTLQEKKEGSAKILASMKSNMAKKTKRKAGSKFAKNPTLHIWCEAYKENYDKEIPHLLGKEKGQLYNVQKSYPEFYEKMVKACLSDWREFCLQVLSVTDLSTYPPEPHTGFFCTHARVAYQFYQEKPLEGFKTQSSDSVDDGNWSKFLN